MRFNHHSSDLCRFNQPIIRNCWILKTLNVVVKHPTCDPPSFNNSGRKRSFTINNSRSSHQPANKLPAIHAQTGTKIQILLSQLKGFRVSHSHFESGVVRRVATTTNTPLINATAVPGQHPTQVQVAIWEEP